MIYGTHHFLDRQAAIKYYKAYESQPAKAVDRKLQEGEIALGKPPLKHNQTCFLIDDGTRWAVKTSRTMNDT